MQVDAPPIDGDARQELAWLLGALLTLILILVLGSGALLLRHDAQLDAHGLRIETTERVLARMEANLDHLLDRHP
ncbi:MAG: hypothetical protein IPM64_10665 [Phycisphaerales bacterium]|nr:hypothetical protein [Phycisphaerales bacterium]